MAFTGSSGDYVSTSGTVSFPAGSTSQPIAVTINGDTAIEASESFRVNLSNAAGASIGDNEGIGTIVNDDTFTDLSLSGLPIRSLHVAELRTAVNGVRAVKGLAPHRRTEECGPTRPPRGPRGINTLRFPAWTPPGCSDSGLRTLGPMSR